MSQELILAAVRKKPCDSYLDEVVKFYRDDFLKKLPRIAIGNILI